MPESVKESHASSWHGEEILQTHKYRFIYDIMQSICPTTPRILCSGLEPVHDDINSLEKVQRRATKSKLVTSLEKLSYEHKLKHLRLHLLYCRRQRGDLIDTFKILNGLENVEANKFFEMRQPVCTRGHTMKIVKPRARLLTRQRFFSTRVIDQ